MISPPRTPLPAMADAATAATTTSGATAPAPAGAFDVILALETLGAPPPSIAADALSEAGLEWLDPAGDADAADSDEDSDGEAVEFLAELMSFAPAPPRVPVSDARSVGSAPDHEPLSAEAPPLTICVAASGEGSGNDDRGSLELPKPSMASNPVAPMAAASDEAGEAGATEAAPRSEANAAPRATELLGHALRHAPGLEEAHEVIETPVRDPRWAEQVATRVTLLLRARESSASLQLTPADLGPLDVQVTVRDSQASVHFGAAHADTRALLEASLPRLREMLAAQGFQLLDASVSQGFARSAREHAAGTPRPTAEAEPVTENAPTRRLAGLLDLYA